MKELLALQNTLWTKCGSNGASKTELELALSKLKLSNKKNPRKLMEEISSCKVKYRVPISNGKKNAQLKCLGGKKYSTVITVT